jgi:hypothetical protein
MLSHHTSNIIHQTSIMSPKVRNFLKLVSYLLALLLGGGMASCNFMNLGPIVY